MTANLEWTVPFSELQDMDTTKGFGPFVESPTFHAAGDESRIWAVKFFPGFVKKKLFAIQLVVKAKCLLEYDCQAIISCTILDESQDQEVWKGSTGYCPVTIYRSIDYDWSNDYDVELIENCHYNKLDFLMDSNLVVRCELKYEVEKLVPSHGHHSDLAADISRFLTSSSNEDVTFIVGQREFPAHKLILAARSPVFAAMFEQEPLNRIEIAEIQPDIFEALLRFICTDQVDNLTEETSKALLAAADRFSLDTLKWNCEEFLKQILTTANCCELLLLARSLEAINLKKSAIREIRCSAEEVMKTEEWKNLKKSCPELVIETCETLLFAERHYIRQQEAIKIAAEERSYYY